MPDAGPRPSRSARSSVSSLEVTRTHDFGIFAQKSPIRVTPKFLRPTYSAASFDPEHDVKQTVIKFGLISGLIIAVCLSVNMMLMEKLGLEHSLVTGYATMVAGFAVVYFGVRSYRDEKLGGRIAFGAAFKTGFLISLITCAFYVAAWEIMYFGGMVGDFEKTYSEQVMAKAKASGASQAKLDSTAAEMKKFSEMYKNPLINIGMTFIEPLPVALLFSLLSAGLLSRRRKEPSATLGRTTG